MNLAILAGRLGRDPECTTTQAGLAIARLSVATSEWRKDAAGQWGERTEWHRVVAFGKLAEQVEQHGRKGGFVSVQGSNRTRDYTDKDGIKRYVTEIVADRIEFAERQPKRDGSSSAEPSKPTGRPASKPSGNRSAPEPEQGSWDSFDPMVEDDIPF